MLFYRERDKDELTQFVANLMSSNGGLSFLPIRRGRIPAQDVPWMMMSSACIAFLSMLDILLMVV